MLKHLVLGKTLAPLADFHKHTHEGWEIILNISGEGYDRVGDETHLFSPGSILCVPPGVFHEKQAAQKFEDIYITTTDAQCFYGKKALTAQDDEFKSLENIFRLIYYYYYRDSQTISPATESLFQALVQLLSARFQTRNIHPYALELQRGIIENFTDPEFTMASILEKLPVCEDYSRKLFQKEFHITPHDYLVKQRIEAAKSLLGANAGSPISQVALSCGFYDAHYFSRIFKKLTGLSPLQYQKVRNNPPGVSENS